MNFEGFLGEADDQIRTCGHFLRLLWGRWMEGLKLEVRAGEEAIGVLQARRWGGVEGRYLRIEGAVLGECLGVEVRKGAAPEAFQQSLL